MTQFIGFLSCLQHGFDTGLMQGSDVDIQGAADGSDIHHILRLIGHDWAAAASQEYIGHVVDGDIAVSYTHLPNQFSTRLMSPSV